MSRDSRLWQDSLAHATVFEGVPGDCMKWLQFAKLKLQFMLHNSPGPLSATYQPADSVTIRVDSRPNRIWIKAGGDRIVFAFQTSAGDWQYLNENTLLLEVFPPATYYIAHSPYTDPPNAGKAIFNTGRLVATDSKAAFCLTVLEFATLGDLNAALGVAGNEPYRPSSSLSAPYYHVAIQVKGKPYKVAILPGGLITGATAITEACVVSLQTANNHCAILFGDRSTGMDSVFTGRYTDGSYYTYGTVPYAFRAIGNFANRVVLRIFALVNEATPGSYVGSTTTEASTTFTPSGAYVNYFISFASITKAAIKTTLSPGSGVTEQSHAVFVVVSKINTDLFARRISFVRVNVSTDGAFLLGPDVALLSFDLTEKDMSFMPSYAGIPFYNRDANAVLGSIEHVEYTKDDGTFVSQLCFIKKELAYTVNAYTPGGSIGIWDNSVTETLKVVKIDLVSATVTYTTLATATATQRFNQYNNAAGGGANSEWMMYLLAGANPYVNLYYADYENDIYVLGRYNASNDVQIQSGTGSPPWPGGSIPVANTVPFEIVAFTPSLSILTTKNASFSGYQGDVIFNPPIPSAFVYYPWTLWNDFQQFGLDSTGLSSRVKTYQIRRESEGNCVGVFSTPVRNSTLAPTTYYIATVGGVPTISSIQDEGIGFTQIPIQVTLTSQ